MNVRSAISILVATFIYANICIAQTNCLDHGLKEFSSDLEKLNSILICLQTANEKQQVIQSENIEIFIKNYSTNKTLEKKEVIVLSNIFLQLHFLKPYSGTIGSDNFILKSYELLNNYFPIENLKQFNDIVNMASNPENNISYQMKKLEELQIINPKDLSTGQIRNILFNYYKYYLHQREISFAQAIFHKYEFLGNQSVVIETNNKVQQLQVAYEAQRKQIQDNQDSKMRIQKLTNIILLVLIAGLLIFSLMSYFVFRNQVAKSKDNTRIIELQQELLTNQMNPHFIFNAITAIHTQILIGKNKTAINYLDRFSNLIQQIFQSTQLKFVSLQSELNTLNEYISLQQLRFYDKFDYRANIDGSIDKSKIFVPPMIIQPFIENAIEHGIRDLDRKGLVELNISYKERLLQCEILDNGKGLKSTEKKDNPSKKSLSTKIAKERLEILSNELKLNGSLLISDRTPEFSKGTRVFIELPSKQIT